MKTSWGGPKRDYSNLEYDHLNEADVALYNSVMGVAGQAPEKHVATRATKGRSKQAKRTRATKGRRKASKEKVREGSSYLRQASWALPDSKGRTHCAP
eukprot:2209802-Prymnesium_polylepis.2